MIRFYPQPEPPAWDQRCRQRGQRWLTNHPDYKRPNDYWTAFEADLREAFLEMCSYCAMYVMKGEMDHFIPVATLKRRGTHELAYEWSNFRYAASAINQRKHDHHVLDPFEVRDRWFSIILPSLQLVLTDSVPTRQRKKAEFTITRLGLRDGEVVIRYRQKWFEMYRSGKLTLGGLAEVAPQIASAVETDLERGKDWRLH
jgi:hypothetical protein